jgi:hypothetical protein
VKSERGRGWRTARCDDGGQRPDHLCLWTSSLSSRGSRRGFGPDVPWRLPELCDGRLKRHARRWKRVEVVPEYVSSREIRNTDFPFLHESGPIDR